MKKLIIYFSIIFSVLGLIIFNSEFSSKAVLSIFNSRETSLVENEKYLIPGGEAFGVKFYTQGAIVIELSAFESDKGTVCPAKDGNIKVSDIIIAVNGQKVTSNNDIAEIANESKGNSINITLRRNSKIIETVVEPAYCISQNSYKTGMWVRDSTAGIGTITYYDPQTNTLAGLGHGISDIDTGILMPMEQGEVIGASITGVIPGEKGSPGQLMGKFEEENILGSLKSNSEKGISSTINTSALPKRNAIPIGDKSFIKEGYAQIISTVNSKEAKYYDIQIESIYPLSGESKNMIIKITDEELLGITGGIVQGMSGSPIIQDGKLVGAVTHVLINDPTRGYGIFIENMLKTAE